MKVGHKRRQHLGAFDALLQRLVFIGFVAFARILSVQKAAQLEQQSRCPDFVVLEILRACRPQIECQGGRFLVVRVVEKAIGVGQRRGVRLR